MSLSKKQKAVLHVAKAKLALDDETYRDILQTHGGVESSKDLDYSGFLSVMKHFERCGFQPLAPERENHSERVHEMVSENRRPPGMATEAQIKKIYALWWSLGGSYYRAGMERKTLHSFLRKRFRVDHERFLNFHQAYGVIEAIKNIAGKPRKGMQA